MIELTEDEYAELKARTTCPAASHDVIGHGTTTADWYKVRVERLQEKVDILRGAIEEVFADDEPLSFRNATLLRIAMENSK